MKQKKKMTLKGYYDFLATQNPQTVLRDEICEALDMAASTFYYKLRNNSFDKLEKKEVARITGRDINELFPTDEN